jgi:DNA-binding MarR family transcriptional regulator
MDFKDPLVIALHDWTKVFMRHSMREFVLFSKQTGLSMSHIGALFRINEGRSSVSDVGGGLGITNAAGSQMVDRLVQQGLILRSEDPDDRRTKRLVLTDKGQHILAQIFHVRQSWLKELAESMSENEKAQIVAALNTLIEKANQLSPATGQEQ